MGTNTYSMCMWEGGGGGGGGGCFALCTIVGIISSCMI